MRDPYLYKDSNVLQNKLNIKVQQELDDAEADYVVFRLKDLILHPIGGEYDLKHLLSIHAFLFMSIFFKIYMNGRVNVELYQFIKKKIYWVGNP